MRKFLSNPLYWSLDTVLRRTLLLGFFAFGILIFITVLQVRKKAEPMEMQVECQRNAQAIAQACLIYAESHQGAFPPSLDVLTQGSRALLPAKQLTCPLSHQTYGYIPGLNSTMCPFFLVVYEKSASHPAGCNAAYLDGHGSTMSQNELQVRMQKTLDRTACGP